MDGILAFAIGLHIRNSIDRSLPVGMSLTETSPDMTEKYKFEVLEAVRKELERGRQDEEDEFEEDIWESNFEVDNEIPLELIRRYRRPAIYKEFGW